MRDEALFRYFSAPAWQRQLEQLRKKALAGYADGVISLKDASPEECLAAERLLGKHFIPPKLRYRMSDLEKQLQTGRFALQDMQDFWLRLDGRPLVPHSRQKADRQDAIDRFFAAEAAQPHGDAAAGWLQAMIHEKSGGYQLLVSHMEQLAEIKAWLHWVCCALDRLEQYTEPEELALCGFAVSTDPHALDLDKPAGRLLLYALAHWQGCGFPAHGRARATLLRRCGLVLDDISNFTVQRGLCFYPADEAEPAAGSAPLILSPLQDGNEFSFLTVSQLEKLHAKSPTGEVYLLENQMVFSALCRHAKIRQPMICTSGQLREASWFLLDLLADSGCRFWYAGDFDPEGLGIADRLWQAYGDRVQFWHMDPADYNVAISHRRIGDPSRLQQLEKIRCPGLQPVARAILQKKAAGYQEALMEQYLHDLCQ